MEESIQSVKKILKGYYFKNGTYAINITQKIYNMLIIKK